MKQELDQLLKPSHIALIMDGNGRWASERGLPRLMGHKMGVEPLLLCIDLCLRHQIRYLTAYAFSTENWKRPTIEVENIMAVLEKAILQKAHEFAVKGVRFQHIGCADGLSDKLRQAIKYATDLTNQNQRLVFNLAINYGGREEIVNAFRQVYQLPVEPEDITEELVGNYLYTSAIAPDLVIRTGGEKRLSNFLPWQTVYSELYFTPVLWPDFDKQDFVDALLDYSQRVRRFGSVTMPY